MIRGLLTTTIGIALLGIGLFYVGQKDFEPVAFSLPPPPGLKGPLNVNTRLQNAQLLLKGRILGPESLVVEGNTIYTGTLDGKLWKIVDGKKEVILSIRPGTTDMKCADYTYDREPVCGRPLGLRRMNEREFLVAEAYSGLYAVDFDEGTIKPIFSSKDSVLDGSKCAFINDLDVQNRTVFFSDSSTRWDRRRFLHDFMEGKKTGRLIRLDLDTGKAEVVLRGLAFANGVQVHPDKQSVLVSECSRARIVRFYFDGPNRGKRELFASNLPGFPDNIRLSHSGKSFLVGLAGVRHANDPLKLLDRVGPHPWLRWAIVQLLPERWLASLFTSVGKKHGFVLELDLEGRVIRSYQDPLGSVVPDVSQASDDADFLYLGSFHSDFIAKVPKKGL